MLGKFVHVVQVQVGPISKMTPGKGKEWSLVVEEKGKDHLVKNGEQSDPSRQEEYGCDQESTMPGDPH